MNINIGKISGIPIHIHWSWWIFLAIQASLNYKLLPVMVVMFGIVLLHELGHCFAARHFGLRVDSITLHLFGGLAWVDDRKQSPWEEFWIIACGPLVNFVLAFPLYFLGEHGGYLADFFATLFVLNLIMLVFNLVPVFPLDGSKIGRSILTALTKNERLSTLTFVWVTRVAAVALGVYALGAPFFHVNAPYMGWLIVLSIIMWLGAEQEIARMPPLPKVYRVPAPTQESLDILNDVQVEMREYRRKYRQ
jgi:Zn-dependent protease